MHAATYPERTRAIALFHPSAHAEGMAARSEDDERDLAELRERWGSQDYCDALLEHTCPTLLARDEDRLWFANWLRVGATPAVAYALNRAWAETDLRDLLPAVHVPTLVLYRPRLMEEAARAVGRLIPGATALRVSGERLLGCFPLGRDSRRGRSASSRGDMSPVVPDTVLSTLLFTDIVRSTERAAELGDAAWRELLDRHHAPRPA